MSNLKPIILYSHAAGPNPWKVAIVLEELGIPYENEFLDFKQVKEEAFTSLNPNGRVPGIKDPNNNDITLWESGAIIDYIIDTYDTSNKLQYASTPEKYQTRVWEHFQMSGQGPYFGQLIWFTRYHQEKVASAVERYEKEVKRVTSVIDDHLKKQGTEYLVGDKITYADLMFVPWYVAVLSMAGDNLNLSTYKAFDAWYKKVTERPAVAKVIKARADAIASSS